MPPIPVTNIKVSQTAAVDILHLAGGLAAGTHKEGGLWIGPMDEKEAAVFPINATREYSRFFEHAGLHLIGFETIYEDTLNSVVWTLLSRAGANVGTIIDNWGGISFSLKTSGNNDLSIQAKRINFGLLASGLRLRDLSREYQKQNNYAGNKQMRDGKSFSNVETLSLFLALHSVLTEMCTARDYLAQFMVKAGLTGAVGDAMAAVASSMKKLPNLTPLESDIVRACDKDGPDPWLAKLGKYRNKIIHGAPIAEVASKAMLSVRMNQWNQHLFRTVRFELPDDPFTMSGNPIDALEYASAALHHLLDLAGQIAKASGITPSFPAVDGSLK